MPVTRSSSASSSASSTASSASTRRSTRSRSGQRREDNKSASNQQQQQKKKQTKEAVVKLPKVLNKNDGGSKTVKEAVVKVTRLTREEIEEHSSSSSASSSASSSPQQPQQRPPDRNNEPEQEERESNRIKYAHDPKNKYLPPKNLFPKESDNHTKQVDDFSKLKQTSVRPIICQIMNEVQQATVANDYEEGEVFQKYFEIVNKLYEYGGEVFGNDGDRESVVGLIRKYKNMITFTIFQFGAVVWRGGSGSGSCYVNAIKGFMECCLMRLGWGEGEEGGDERGGRGRRRRKMSKKSWNRFVMDTRADELYYPSCYYCVNLFVKHHSDVNTNIRLHQIQFLHRLVATAVNSTKSSSSGESAHFINHVFKYARNNLLIRLKDKSPNVRAVAMEILCVLLVNVQGSEEALVKELKYYTRYDPSPEVRKIGVKGLSGCRRLKLRFFFDQAFDKDPSVRSEAFKAMSTVYTVEGGSGSGGENGGVKMVRGMEQLQKEKLCKLVLWGALYSDAKCSTYIKQELLPLWLAQSCNNDYVKLIQMLDPYDHHKGVNKIIDLMFEGDQGGRLAESIDLGFIDDLKRKIHARDFKSIEFEGLIGWLGLVKRASCGGGNGGNDCGGLRRRVVPDFVEMIAIVNGLLDCVMLENTEAQEEGRVEGSGPILAVVVALEICKFVDWEESGRQEMKILLKKILNEPVLDEKMLVVLAMNVLFLLCDGGVDEFDDLLLPVFQDVFEAKKLPGDAANGGNGSRHRRHGNSGGGEVPNDIEMGEQEGGGGEVEMGEEVEEEEEEELPVALTQFELMRLKDKLCGVMSSKFKFENEKEKAVKEKRFKDAGELVTRIKEAQEEELRLRSELKANDDVVKRIEEVKQRKEAAAVAMAVNAAAAAGGVEMSGGVVDDLDGSVSDEDGEGPVDMDTSGIITSVEEGLAKGMFMINSYMDLRGGATGINSFVRNLYENYVGLFMTQDQDVMIRANVLQFMTRVALVEKKQLRKVANVLIQCLAVSAAVEIELVLSAFKCLVDLMIVYDWKDFLVAGGDDGNVDLNEHPYVDDYDRHLKKLLDNEEISYLTATENDIKSMMIELVARRFPGGGVEGNNSNAAWWNLVMVKWQGILKLLVRGRLREPSIIKEVLMLWAQPNFSGTCVLRDLECVLKVYGVFGEWWGKGGASVVEMEEDGEMMAAAMGTDDGNGDEEDVYVVDEAMRVLGVGVGDAVVGLCCSEASGNNSNGRAFVEDGGEVIIKFVMYFLGFLDRRDQPLMRTIAITILSQVEKYPTRSYNTILVKCASKIPITSLKSAQLVMDTIDSIYVALRPHPVTTSVTNVRNELSSFVKKLGRVFGEGLMLGRRAAGRSRHGSGSEGDESDHEQNVGNDDDDIPDVVDFSD